MVIGLKSPICTFKGCLNYSFKILALFWLLTAYNIAIVIAYDLKHIQFMLLCENVKDYIAEEISALQNGLENLEMDVKHNPSSFQQYLKG